MAGGRALAALATHDERCLTGEGAVVDAVQAGGEVLSQGRLAGSRVAAEVEDLRCAGIAVPARYGAERLILLGGGSHGRPQLWQS